MNRADYADISLGCSPIDHAPFKDEPLDADELALRLEYAEGQLAKALARPASFYRLLGVGFGCFVAGLMARALLDLARTLAAWVLG